MQNQRNFFWNERAVQGIAAGTNDIIAKQLEIEAIASYIMPGMKILDFGCGNGVTAIELAKRFPVKICGVDYAKNMISEAIVAAKSNTMIGDITFIQGDHIDFEEKVGSSYDIVYSERSIINLDDWETQRITIEKLIGRLKHSGRYIMCENSQEGLESINKLRKSLQLDAINAPWHNRYLREQEIAEATFTIAVLEDINHYSSTYYLLSRVLNAALAAQEGTPPIMMPLLISLLFNCRL